MTKMNSVNVIPSEMIANNQVPFEPTHPGDILREEIEERGITQTQLAQEIGLSVSTLNEVINGKRAVTTEYALLLEAALGIDADFWLRMQTSYNKHVVKSDASFMERLSKIRKIAAVL